MKKFYQFLLLFTCVFALISCEELGFGDDGSDSLSGTSWQHIEYNTAAGTVHTTLSFSSSTFTMTIKQSQGTNQTYKGKYEYSKGSGTLYIDGDPAYVTVNGHDLTLSWGGVRIAFTKK